MKNVLVVKNTGISEEGTTPRKKRACCSPVMSASRSTTRPTMLESGTTSQSFTATTHAEAQALAENRKHS